MPRPARYTGARSAARWLATAVALLAGCGGAAPLGGECEDDRACASGLRCEVGFPGGACVADCPGGTACPPGGVCRDLSGLEVCLPACASGADCRAGYACQAGACDLPCASNADCDAGEQCDTASGACVAAPPPCTAPPLADGCACASDDECDSDHCQPPEQGGVCTRPAPPLPWIELGAFPTTPAAGTGVVTVTLPAGAVGFTIVAEAIGRAVCPFPRRLVDPSGTPYFDAAMAGSQGMRLWPQFEVMTVLVPDRDGGPPLPGDWTIEIDTFSCPEPPEPFTDLAAWLGIADGSAAPVASTIDRLAVLPKTGFGGAIHINLYLTPASGVSAAAAPTDPWVVGFLNRFFEVHDVAITGLSLGSITYFDAPATYNTIDTFALHRAACADLSDTAPDGGPALNVVVVGGFAGELGFATGIAGGIPGSMLTPGTGGACVLAEARTFSDVSMGSLVAHEGGHQLGLWHTSEVGGASCIVAPTVVCYDAISDTAECPNPGGAGQASCGDFTNMMWPSATPETSFGGTLTPGQGEVMSRIPIAR